MIINAMSVAVRSIDNTMTMISDEFVSMTLISAAGKQ